MPVTPTSFSRSVLRRLGIQPTHANLQAMVGWTQAEGGHWNNDARHNPLNTTQPMPGAGNTGSQGNIKQYRTWRQGVRATARTLRNGNYGAILQALEGGNPQQVAAAIDSSPWGTHGDLIHRTIASAHPGGGGRVIGGGGGGGGGGQQLLQVTGGVQGVPQGSEGLLSLVSALQSRSQPRSSAGVAAPAFSASAVMPQGAQTPVSGGGPAPKANVNELLAAVQTAGGDIGGLGGGSVQQLPGVNGSRDRGLPGGAQGAVAYAQKNIGKFRESNGSNRGPRLDKLQRRFGFTGQAWCAMFTSAAAVQGGMPRNGRTASVAEVRRQATVGGAGYERGFKRRPQPGDLVLFGNDHIGMVESVRGGRVTTIEGNTSEGRVARRSRGLGEGDYVRPRYRR